MSKKRRKIPSYQLISRIFSYPQPDSKIENLQLTIFSTRTRTKQKALSKTTMYNKHILVSRGWFGTIIYPILDSNPIQQTSWDWSFIILIYTICVLLFAGFWELNEPPRTIQQQIANEYFSYLRRFCGNNRDRPTYLQHWSAKRTVPSKLASLRCWTLKKPHSVMFLASIRIATCVFCQKHWYSRHCRKLRAQLLKASLVPSWIYNIFEGVRLPWMNKK